MYFPGMADAYIRTIGLVLDPILNAFFRTKLGQRMMQKLVRIDPEAPLRKAFEDQARILLSFAHMETTMFTADDARRGNQNDLDERIERAVRDGAPGNSAYLRIYVEDAFCHTIGEELERRGFKNIDVPSIILKGDVYFEWD